MKTLVDFFSSETFGFLLKIFAGLAAAAFGILGIGTQTRDKRGKLTRNGWIALVGIIVAGLLAVGTSIYEFATNQQKAKEDREKSERLMLAVQTGIYPLRGITGFLFITFEQDFAGLRDYKNLLRRSLPPGDGPLCKKTRDYSCWHDPATGTTYNIPETSRLYPGPNSPVRLVLDNLGVVVTLAKSGPGDVDENYSKLGQFRFRVHEMQARSKMITFSTNGVFGYRIDDFKIADSIVSDSDVTSLIQVFPGFVAARPDMVNPFFCQLLTIVDCVHDVMPALKRGMKLEDLSLRFEYPKALRFLPDDRDIQCGSEKGRSVVLPLSGDVDEINSIGEMPPLKTPDVYMAKICPALYKFNPN